jgi:hypothetical protein
MGTKLHDPDPRLLLRARFPFMSVLPGPEIHIQYANFDFAVSDSLKRARRIIQVFGPPTWTPKRTFEYLKRNQQPFRDCLQWLSDDAALETGYSAAHWDGAVQEWSEHPPLKFLRLHGLTHAGVDLGFREVRDGFFLGLELVQKGARDPLDVLCWHLLSLLMWEGELSIKRCSYDGCRKFFAAHGKKKFCDANCRAKFGRAKLTPEEKRDYMRKYRAQPAVKKRTPRPRSARKSVLRKTAKTLSG